MVINKYQGKTEEEAKAKARESLGGSVVIMNVKEIRPKGLFGIFKNSTYEVTAAIEEVDYEKHKSEMAGKSSASTPIAQQTKAPASGFSAVVNDNTEINGNTGNSINAASVGINENELKDAFSAVNDLLSKPASSTDSASAVDKAPAATAIMSQHNPQVGNSKLNAYKSASSTASKPLVPLSETAPKFTTVENDKYITYSAQPVRANNNAAIVQTVAGSDEADNKNVKSRTDIEDSVRSNEPSNYSIVKMLYNQLLDNEVQEKYINQVLDDMDKILATSHSLDNLLSSVYQKMVLKLGRPKTISVGGKRPRVIFFIGPTGVGKTTTIAKLASKFKVEEGKKVGLITTDTYRMAAADQLRTYATILSVPMSVVYSGEELNDAIKSQVRNYDDLDLIFVDTIGFSHNNDAQKEDLKKLLDTLDENYEKDIYLVLSATTKYRDLIDITDTYSEFTGYSIIFTKLDETACYGNIYNIKQRTGAQLSYITNGQNVPDDIDAVDMQKLVKQLLGGS